MSLQTSAAQLPAFAGPLYVQVAGILRAKICASEWTSRAPLPNEVTLARDIGVSIGMVRKALEMLESERLIQRRQGRGTYVLETSDECELERFSNFVAGSKKLRAGPTTWSCVTGDATDDERRLLALAPSSRVYRLEAYWASANTAAVVENITVPEARFPGLPGHLADGGQFLFPIYRRHYQEVINNVTEAVTCVNADAVLAARLNVPADHAVLLVERIAYAFSGGAVEWSRRAVHLQRASYTVTMT